MDLRILDMNYSHKRKIRMVPSMAVKRMLVEISRLSEISADCVLTLSVESGQNGGRKGKEDRIGEKGLREKHRKNMTQR